MSDVKENNLITIKNAARKLGIKSEIIQYQIDLGKIESVEGMVDESVCDRISEQQNLYIGIKMFLKNHDSDRFDSRYSKNRDKYIDFLEDNDFFGIEIVDSEDVLFALPEKEEFYLLKEDAQYLEYRSEMFFEDFGLTEAEKVRKIISHSKEHPSSKNYIKKYLDYIKDDSNIYTPALTMFVKAIFDIADVKLLTDEDIVSVVENAVFVRTKELLVDFFQYVAKYEIVKYHKVKLRKKESYSEPAYSYEEFVKLAKVLFNEDYDKEHGLSKKALENSKYAEMWMFLSCHYVCGWRASDICDRWVYLTLKSNDNPFKINIETLKEDILNGNISEKTYKNVALYAVRRIEMANNTPGKTGLGKLRSEVVPELQVFFGKLMLIAEYHHISSGKGYMNSNRSAEYRNWVKCKEFFGEDIFAITGKRSISSRRLNKSYLQGIEQSAKDNGNTTLVAHMVASFARSHANISTTLIYLKDHGLTGESADVVLYSMWQRKVFGAYLYYALIAAYPESFEKLPMREQTMIMELIPLSVYELETLGTTFLASYRIKEVFSEGKTEEPKEILKAMFAISQGMGKGKDKGVYCKKRALGLSCINPKFNSCIANVCPHHVFTSEGVPALVEVIKDYQRKFLSTGNMKYKAALKTKIVPAFQDIINAIIREMSEEEKAGMRKLLQEALNE